MAIKSEGHGFFSIQGVTVDSTKVTRAGAGMTATTESPLAKLHEHIFNPYNEHRQLKGLVVTMLNNEDEARRLKLLDLDSKIFDYFQTARVGSAMDKVRGILADADLTPEAQQKRALIEVEAVSGRVRAHFARIITDLLDKLNQTEKLVEGALKPLPRTGENAVINEIRATEVRGYIAGLDEPGRMAAVLGFGEGAKLEALAALAEDPRGRDFVSAEVLNQARKSAILAQDGEWLLDRLADDRDMLQGAASRMAMVEALLWDGARVLGAQASPPYAPWPDMARKAVSESEKILSL